MLLRERHVQPSSRQKEKFYHPYIGRQHARVQRIDIGQIRIAAEQAIDDGRDERRSSRFAGFGFSSVSAEKKVRLMARVGASARIERVDDVVGLAEPKRQPDHQFGPDIAA